MIEAANKGINLEHESWALILGINLGHETWALILGINLGGLD